MIATIFSFRTIFLVTGIVSALSSNANAEKIVVPVVNEMILNLGNYAQQIEVRAKSMGPGGCAVTFLVNGEETRFLAPPLSWSDWVKTSPAYLSPATVTLEFLVGCDTGAIAEARFNK